VDLQSVTFAVWLAFPVLALIGATLTLWHTRHHLQSFQQRSAATPVRLAPAHAAPQGNPAIAS
jgi:hypothetical protein